MLGAQIYALRMQRGWTQANLAKKINVSVKSIKNWEADVSDPSVHNIVLIASVFSIAIDHLFGMQSQDIIVLKGISDSEKRKVKALIQFYINNIAE